MAQPDGFVRYDDYIEEMGGPSFLERFVVWFINFNLWMLNSFNSWTLWIALLFMDVMYFIFDQLTWIVDYLMAVVTDLVDFYFPY